jgi:hypothetical protein
VLLSSTFERGVFARAASSKFCHDIVEVFGERLSRSDTANELGSSHEQASIVIDGSLPCP